jgi:cold-inducible RNA-binding protein
MAKKIYVGNLPFSSTEDQVRDLFSQYGTVTSVSLITDRQTGNFRGFGFVEMEEGADKAINALNNHQFDGRTLNVNEARPREQGARTGGGGGGGRRDRW